MTYQFPPNYTAVYIDRARILKEIRQDPKYLLGAKEHYKNGGAQGVIDFIEELCFTYDPRNADSETLPTLMPFILFPKQREFVQFLYELLTTNESGLIEKARDAGMTWVCSAFSVWMWLYRPGSSVGWGSRKEVLVDKLGDMDSIFEKIRTLIRELPPEFLPIGLNPKDHLTFMKCINPENGATITGEAGDNIGRGGRKTIYFKDESAHYERPELIEAALSANTNIQIDISSVNGTGNVFWKTRQAGVMWSPGAELARRKRRVFILDWRDDPRKTEEWYRETKQSYIDRGLAHLFAQEYERDYAASVEGVIIPAIYVQACIDAHKVLGFDDVGDWHAALDVADDVGGDTNAWGGRKGVILKKIDEWGGIDTGKTTNKAIDHCEALGIATMEYDCIGVGAGVKAEANRLRSLPKDHPDHRDWQVSLNPWNAGATCLYPEAHVIKGDRKSPINKDFYANLKAQAWWELRKRCERTWRARNEPNFTWKPEDLISFDRESLGALLHKLVTELSQPTKKKHAGTNRLVVDKVPDNQHSPNLADMTVMLYWPVKSAGYSLDDLRKAL